MKYLIILFALVTLTACDPGWSVSRELKLPPTDDECIRQAINETEGINGVIKRGHVKYTFKGSGIDSVYEFVYEFETNLANGYVEYYNNNVTVSFGGIGTRVPPKIADNGPQYLDAVINSINSKCNVKGTVNVESEDNKK